MVGGGTFSPLAPVLSLEQKQVAMSPSSTVHGGRYDTECDIQVDSASGIREGDNFRLFKAPLGNGGTYRCCDSCVLCVVLLGTAHCYPKSPTRSSPDPKPCRRFQEKWAALHPCADSARRHQLRGLQLVVEVRPCKFSLIAVSTATFVAVYLFMFSLYLVSSFSFGFCCLYPCTW